MTTSTLPAILDVHMALLLQLRHASGKTQEQVCLDLGIGESTLSRHERGVTTPTQLQILGYATYYGVPPESIEQPTKTNGKKAA